MRWWKRISEKYFLSLNVSKGSTMSTKKISVASGAALFVVSIFLSFYSIYGYGNESLEPYQQQARDASSFFGVK